MSPFYWKLYCYWQDLTRAPHTSTKHHWFGQTLCRRQNPSTSSLLFSEFILFRRDPPLSVRPLVEATLLRRELLSISLRFSRGDFAWLVRPLSELLSSPRALAISVKPYRVSETSCWSHLVSARAYLPVHNGRRDYQVGETSPRTQNIIPKAPLCRQDPPHSTRPHAEGKKFRRDFRYWWDPFSSSFPLLMPPHFCETSPHRWDITAKPPYTPKVSRFGETTHSHWDFMPKPSFPSELGPSFGETTTCWRDVLVSPKPFSENSILLVGHLPETTILYWRDHPLVRHHSVSETLQRGPSLLYDDISFRQDISANANPSLRAQRFLLMRHLQVGKTLRQSPIIIRLCSSVGETPMCRCDLLPNLKHYPEITSFGETSCQRKSPSPRAPFIGQRSQRR